MFCQVWVEQELCCGRGGEAAALQENMGFDTRRDDFLGWGITVFLMWWELMVPYCCQNKGDIFGTEKLV